MNVNWAKNKYENNSFIVIMGDINVKIISFCFREPHLTDKNGLINNYSVIITS